MSNIYTTPMSKLPTGYCGSPVLRDPEGFDHIRNLIEEKLEIGLGGHKEVTIQKVSNQWGIKNYYKDEDLLNSIQQYLYSRGFTFNKIELKGYQLRSVWVSTLDDAIRERWQHVEEQSKLDQVLEFGFARASETLEDLGIRCWIYGDEKE